MQYGMEQIIKIKQLRENKHFNFTPLVHINTSIMAKKRIVEYVYGGVAQKCYETLTVTIDASKSSHHPLPFSR